MDFLSTLFVLSTGLLILVLIFLFLHDKFQSTNAIQRNYPVLARLRPISTTLGEFFRRYISDSDREGQPFSRDTREWVQEAAAGKKDIRSFGTELFYRDREFYFKSAVFPINTDEAEPVTHPIIGPLSEHPYTPQSLFNMSAMSFGSLSAPAIEALSLGTALAKCWMNTGEGGLSQYHLQGNGDIVFEIGTAKYGIRDVAGILDEDKLKNIAANPQIKMFELKLSQGAKPGKGGVLPGSKVTQEISKIRNIPKGKDSISPNRHAEASTIEELLDFINYLKLTTTKPVGFKTAVGNIHWFDELCTAMKQRDTQSLPDFITIDGSEGGTGASPMMLMDRVAMSIRQALPQVNEVLDSAGLKDRIRIIASGKLVTAGEVAWALASGADYVVSARGFMFSIGCIQAMRCHTDSCPSGVATHDPDLQRALIPSAKKIKVAQYVKNIQEEVEVIAHSCGLKQSRGLKTHHLG